MTDQEKIDVPPSPASDGFIPSNSDNISVFPDPVMDNVIHVLISLGAEVWSTRRRLFILEKVLEKAGVSTADVESYVPTPEETAAWEEERNIFINRAFDALKRKGGANESQIDTSPGWRGTPHG